MTPRCLRAPALCLGLLAAAVALPSAAAQEAPPAAPAKDAPAAAAATPPLTAVPENYTYRPDGRRDPFVSLVGRGADTAIARRGEGLAALSTSEISIRGVLQSRGGYVAIVQGPDQKTHIVRANDRLADGTVQAITPQGLVILQEVNDPLSLVQHREVRKGFPGSEGK